jgi:hypothetical protein
VKNFNKKIYSLNIDSAYNVESSIPKEYWKMAINIANSYSKEYKVIGIMNINDLMQEGFVALLKSWSNIDWNYINNLETKIDKEKAISKYLKISIKGLVGDAIKNNVDGSKKPIKGVWNNKDKKRHTTGFGFVSVLFPHWFDSDVLSFIENEVYDYDFEKLGSFLDGWLLKYLPKYDLMMKMFYGIDDVYSKPKKMAEIALFYGTHVENVKKQKQRLLLKLKTNEDALKELAFFIATNGIKTCSKAHDYAEAHLKIYQD